MPFPAGVVFVTWGDEGGSPGAGVAAACGGGCVSSQELWRPKREWAMRSSVLEVPEAPGVGLRGAAPIMTLAAIGAAFVGPVAVYSGDVMWKMESGFMVICSEVLAALALRGWGAARRASLVDEPPACRLAGRAAGRHADTHTR